jgi:hypothetical protein
MVVRVRGLEGQASSLMPVSILFSFRNWVKG